MPQRNTGMIGAITSGLEYNIGITLAETVAAA
jgi:hypothetical protein